MPLGRYIQSGGWPRPLEKMEMQTMPEVRRFFRHGGSLCFTIPPAYAKAMDIRVGNVALLVLGSDGVLGVRKMALEAGKVQAQNGGTTDKPNPANPPGFNPRAGQPDPLNDGREAALRTD